MNNPDWLFHLRKEMGIFTGKAAAEIWPNPDGKPYFNYRLEHVRQVERDARWLLQLVGGDEDIVLAAVWLHDSFQPQLMKPDNHAVLAAEWVREHLSETGFPVEKIEAVAYAIEMHSSPVQSLPEDSHEARVLWDADKLTKLGPISLVNMLAVMPAFPEHKMNYGEIVRMAKDELARRKTLVDLFYFPASRERAAQRIHAQDVFVHQLQKDIAGV
jgi:HD superfamily phosphodiesterase